MSRQSIRCVIVDYGMGNLRSVRSATEYLGIKTEISSDLSTIRDSTHVILPGVGSFRVAAANLEHSGIADVIRHFAKNESRRLLGICLGMQLLGSDSTEDGGASGLGLIPLNVGLIGHASAEKLTLPHVGWNSVHTVSQTGLFTDIHQDSHFYFVHSYAVKGSISTDNLGTTKYGEVFISALQYENISATQFHPEKSQSNGLRLLRNFFNN